MEYVTERLIQQVCTEFVTRQLDLFQSHALIRVEAKDYICEIQRRSTLPPVTEWLLFCYKTVSEVEDRARQLLAQQRQKSGCVTANPIDLLVQQQADSKVIWV